MVVESVDTADLEEQLSRKRGNRLRDALKVGELSALAGVTTPSQAPRAGKV